MKPNLVLCVLLGVVLSVRAATLYPTVEDITDTTNLPMTSMNPNTNTTTPTPTTVPNTSSRPGTTTPCCMTPPSPPTTTTTSPPTLSQIMCPEGWEVFEGRCYYFVNEAMTWPQALSTCAMLGSMMVSVHSAQEYGFLQQLTIKNENQNAWLGGFYLQDQWLWMDGSWFYNNTWSGETVMYYPDSSNPCLMLTTYQAWSNSQCNTDYSPICVKDSNVPPAMLCPEGWTGFFGRCYQYIPESLTWAQADTKCAGLGASLVSVHSPEEYAFLYQLAALQGETSAWLGGFYLEDQWLWLDGSWFYQGFYMVMSAPDSDYECLSIYSPTGWTNYNCVQTFPSFCVKKTAV